MRTTVGLLCLLGALLAAPPASSALSAPSACEVTTSAHANRRYGGPRLWTVLPRGGVLRAQPDHGTLGTKLGWIPDRHRGLELTVSGRRLDGPGRLHVRSVRWGYSSAGKGSWATAVSFPAAGCWRLTGRVGAATLSYVVRVVAG